MGEATIKKWILEIRSYPNGEVFPKLIPIGGTKKFVPKQKRKPREIEVNNQGEVYL